jgi:hypothetical protein
MKLIFQINTGNDDHVFLKCYKIFKAYKMWLREHHIDFRSCRFYDYSIF